MMTFDLGRIAGAVIDGAVIDKPAVLIEQVTFRCATGPESGQKTSPLIISLTIHDLHVMDAYI